MVILLCSCWTISYGTLQGSHGQGKVGEKCKKFKVREKSGNFEISQGNLKKWQKSGNFRIRRRNFKIVKEKEQVAMAVPSKNKHGCVCHSVSVESLFC